MTQEKIAISIADNAANIARIIREAGEDPDTYFETDSAEGALLQQLIKMVDRNEAGNAEDILFDRMHADPTAKMLKVALRFYVMLSGLTNEQQEDNNFYLGEVLDGMVDACSIYVSASDEGVG